MTRKRTPAPKRRPKKIRLLKVLLQPVYVIEDGDDREEMAGSGPNGQPIVISGKEWPNVVTQLEEVRKATEKQLNERTGDE